MCFKLEICTLFWLVIHGEQNSLPMFIATLTLYHLLIFYRIQFVIGYDSLCVYKQHTGILELIQGICKRPTYRFEDTIVWERWNF